MGYRVDEYIERTGEQGTGVHRAYDRQTGKSGYVDEMSGYFHPDPEKKKDTTVSSSHDDTVFQSKMNDVWNTFEQESRDVLIEGTHQFFVAFAAAIFTLFSLWRYKGKYSTKNIWRSYPIKDALLITCVQYFIMFMIVLLFLSFIAYGLSAIIGLINRLYIMFLGEQI